MTARGRTSAWESLARYLQKLGLTAVRLLAQSNHLLWEEILRKWKINTLKASFEVGKGTRMGTPILKTFLWQRLCTLAFKGTVPFIPLSPVGSIGFKRLYCFLKCCVRVGSISSA